MHTPGQESTVQYSQRKHTDTDPDRPKCTHQGKKAQYSTIKAYTQTDLDQDIQKDRWGGRHRLIHRQKDRTAGTHLDTDRKTDMMAGIDLGTDRKTGWQA